MKVNKENLLSDWVNYSVYVLYFACAVFGEKMIFPQDNGIGFGAFLDVPI